MPEQTPEPAAPDVKAPGARAGMFDDKTSNRLKQNKRRRSVVNKDYGVMRDEEDAYKPRSHGYKSRYI